MALISKRKGRKTGSGYRRIFDDNALGFLVSRVQAAVISAGLELERIVEEKSESIVDIDAVLQSDMVSQSVKLATKKAMRTSKILDFPKSKPNFMVFGRKGKNQHCYIIGLKDGDTFDAKKAAAEKKVMQDFISKNAQRIPFTCTAHFVCFNQNDKKAIHEGFKKEITLEECMTGREFCELLNIDYDEILKQRTSDGNKNFKYFLTELINIPSVKKFLDENNKKQF